MIGRVVSHYTITEKLGQGGMGEVYLALDALLDRKVALKFLSSELRSDANARQRFVQEARSAAVLDHPFICKVYEAGEAGEDSFIAMEYVEGRNLGYRLLEGPLPVQEALHLITEVAEALEVAHDRQIVHRDLKPGNIMLTHGVHVKVMDFGLAKRLVPLLTKATAETEAPALTSPGAIVGTLDYMSPEQIRGREVDTRSDIFSLGVVLYESVTGIHPFRRGTPMDTGSAILRDPVAPLSRFARDVPPALEHVVKRMLARERDDRYQSVRDLIRDLRLIRLESSSATGRRLAAIMFTQMAGYDSMVQQSEQLAMQLLEEHWRLLRTLLPKHDGQEIKTIGNSLLVEFASALQAVECAIEIQRTLRDRNASVQPERQIRLRIGLHLGDVIHQASDVFGDGIGIASRLQPLAVPGGICVSEDVANQVANKIEYALREVPGNGLLGDIRRPIRVFAVDLPWERPASPSVTPSSEGGVAGRERIRPTASPVPWRFPAWARRRTAGWIGLAALAFLSLLVWWLVHPRTTAFGFQERDWIVICDFENSTGEHVFDKSLDTALRVSVTQSSYVNVIPQSRIIETLRRMKRDSSTRIGEPIAREIAQREGIKLILIPSIAGVGGAYAISSTLEDPESGVALQSETVHVRGKEEILSALDRLARRTRESLGESASAISRQGKGLVKVTTSSLEALKQFSLAVEKQVQGDIKGARFHLENALAIDPDFTSAKAILGMIHWEAAQMKSQWGFSYLEGFDRQLGKTLLTEAVARVETLSDRERYNVLTFYARAVEDDLPKAIQHSKVLVGMYPDDAGAHNNLGWYYRQMGRLDEAIAEYKEALRIDPTLMLSYDSLAGIYLYEAVRPTEALALCQAQIDRNDGHFQAYDNLGWACLATEQWEKARASYEKAILLSPRIARFRFRLAHSYRMLGRYNEALRSLGPLTAEDDFSVDYHRAVLYLLLNDGKEASKHLEVYRALVEKNLRSNPKEAYWYLQKALILARLGQRQSALDYRKKALALDSGDHFDSALVAAVLGNTDEALDLLDLAIQKGFKNYVWMKIHPDLQSLYGIPRFEAMLARVLQ